MGWGARTWFFLLSGLYLVVAFLLGELVITGGLQLIKDGTWGSWRFTEPAFLISGGVWCGAVFLIQIGRIKRSLARHNRATEQVLRRSFLSFELNGQPKLLWLLAPFPAICWVVSRFRTEPLLAVGALVAGVAMIAGLLIWQRASRRRWAIRDGDDRRAAAALFELVTRNIDPEQPLRWSYLLKNIPEDRLDALSRTAREMGFNVGRSQIDREQVGYLTLTLSEDRVHTVDSYCERLSEIDRFAKFHELELADCSAGNFDTRFE
jgi:hypothetical protein